MEEKEYFSEEPESQEEPELKEVPELSGPAEEQKKSPNFGGYSKFFVYSVIAIVFAFFAGFIFIKNYTEKMSDYNEKIIQYDTIKSENSKLQQENENLKQQIAYLNTKSGVESVAREKLGLIKPAEIAIVVLNDDNTKNTKATKQTEKKQSKPNGNNPDKQSEGWFTKMWSSFFGEKTKQE